MAQMVSTPEGLKVAIADDFDELAPLPSAIADGIDGWIHGGAEVESALDDLIQGPTL